MSPLDRACMTRRFRSIDHPAPSDPRSDHRPIVACEGLPRDGRLLHSEGRLSLHGTQRDRSARRLSRRRSALGRCSRRGLWRCSAARTGRRLTWPHARKPVWRRKLGRWCDRRLSRLRNGLGRWLLSHRSGRRLRDCRRSRSGLSRLVCRDMRIRRLSRRRRRTGRPFLAHGQGRLRRNNLRRGVVRPGRGRVERRLWGRRHGLLSHGQE
jgi:hypothetical protein